MAISEKGLDEKVKVMGREAIEDSHNKELKEFRSIVLSKLVRFWDDSKDIKIAIHETLSEFGYNEKLLGWVRPDKSINTNLLLEQISKLTKENSDLKNQFANSNESRIGDISFSQMKKLLSQTLIKIEDKEITLLNFLMKEGFNLGGYGIIFDADVSDEVEREPYEKLSVFKIINEVGGTANWRYKFSDFGHTFFLLCLTEKSNE